MDLSTGRGGRPFGARETCALLDAGYFRIAGLWARLVTAEELRRVLLDDDDDDAAAGHPRGGVRLDLVTLHL